MLHHQRQRWQRRRFVVVSATPRPATGRPGTDTGTDGSRAPRHVVHARSALRQDGEAHERERGADQATSRRHGPVVAQQPNGRLRQRRQEQRQVDGHELVGRRMTACPAPLLCSVV